MTKPRKEAADPPRWTVYQFRGKRLVWMGAVEAHDEEEAREKALKQLDIRPADQFRISVRRE